jgi:hypothetical protein
VNCKILTQVAFEVMKQKVKISDLQQAATVQHYIGRLYLEDGQAFINEQQDVSLHSAHLCIHLC